MAPAEEAGMTDEDRQAVERKLRIFRAAVSRMRPDDPGREEFEAEIDEMERELEQVDGPR
jgi:hypothetical protein